MCPGPWAPGTGYNMAKLVSKCYNTLQTCVFGGGGDGGGGGGGGGGAQWCLVHGKVCILYTLEVYFQNAAMISAWRIEIWIRLSAHLEK